jgi:hypothetical protein
METQYFNYDPSTEEEVVRVCQKNTMNNDQNTANGICHFTPGILIKFGIGVMAQEARNQDYVYRHTDRKILRVPKVFKFFQSLSPSGVLLGYIVMEHIEHPDLSISLELQKATEIINLIVDAINHLHSIPVPNDVMPGPEGGGLLCGYLWLESTPEESFDSLQAFQYW